MAGQTKTVLVNPAVILSELTDLEQDFYDFFKDYSTFNGWALTLNNVEFDELMVDFTLKPGKKGKAPPKHKILEFILEGKTSFDYAEFSKDLVLKGRNLKRISLCRIGYMSYKAGETDADWTFKVTELGKEKLDETENF